MQASQHIAFGATAGRLVGMDERRLLLIRHAKTEQGFPDRSRKLTGRGQRDAREIGRWLAAHHLRPDHVVVSPATRAVETWKLAAAELPGHASVTVDERVYDNTVDDILAAARATDASVRTLAIVGHNPSLEALTARWSDRDELRTGSVALFTVAAPWEALSAAVLVDLVTCRG